MTRSALKRTTINAFKRAWLAACAKGNAVEGAFAVAKGCATEVVKAEGASDRVREFIASTPDVDRDGDTVAVEGWELDNFIKSGSGLLWAHDYSAAPLAKQLSVFAKDGALRLRVEFPDKDMPHNFGTGFGFGVMRMFDEGLLRGVSVGFIPKEWSYNEERGGWAPTDFKRQELLEVSATPVPANPNAIAVARSKGIDVDPLVAWVETARDKGAGLWVPKQVLDDLLDQSVTSESASASTSAVSQSSGEVAKASPEDTSYAATAEKSAAKSADAAHADAFAALLKAESSLVDQACGAVASLAKQGRVLSQESSLRLRQMRDLLASLLEVDTDEAPPEEAITVEELRAMAAKALDDNLNKLLGRLPD